MIQSKRLKRLFKEMIDIYSPSGKEKEIVDYLYRYLKRADLSPVRQEVEADRENLIIIPENKEPVLMMVGHLDTVTAYDLKSYYYEEDRENSDQVFGLGAADMKGGCAAMIEAFHSFHESGKSHIPVAMALVVGEEENGDGTKKLLDDYPFSIAIVGEPTNLQPCFSHYGYIEAQITTTGNKRHASMATPVNNAVEVMLQVLLKISNHFKENRSLVVYNIRNLASSESGFAVPHHCEVWIDFHVPFEYPLGEIAYEIEELLDKEQKTNPDVTIALEISWLNAGYQLPHRGPLFEDIQEIYQSLAIPFVPKSFRSHSDANLLWEIGIKPVILGPGQLENAHMVEESIFFSQVVDAARIYERIIEKWSQMPAV